MIVRYDSIPALCRDAATSGMTIARQGYSGRFSWIQPATLSNAIEKAKYGNPALVPLAESLIDKVNSRVESTWDQWQSSVTGAYPCVPDHLIGLPESMRVRLPVRSENVPINIFVCVSLSCGMSERETIERGVAILALVMALQKYRPVTLEVCNIGALKEKTYPFKEIEDYVSVAPINTNPIDLATACHVMTNKNFVDHIMYSLEAFHSNDVCWPNAYSNNKEGYLTDLYQRLGGRGDDIIINPGYLDDCRGIDPVDWVNKQIERVLARESE